MHNGYFRRTLLASAAVLLIATSAWQAVAGPFNWINFVSGKGVNLKNPACGECGSVHGADEQCIERVPVEKCVVGKKKVFDSKIRYEYVSIPETRYRWKNRMITKEIPCPYCKPVCKTEDGERCIRQEKWESDCTECSQLHCKHMEPVIEKTITKQCAHEKGETTIKVKYRSCVKEPYTVYRRVKRPVCVKEPRYEKVKVTITKYVCKGCNDSGCSDCNAGGDESCSQCNGHGCDYCQP